MLGLPLALLSLLFPVTASAAVSNQAHVDKLRGVLPAKRSLYVPTAEGRWKCLDGEKEIPWNRVNDDFCDCLDGSDEPGTSACPNSTFYCANEGHLGATIPSSRVNDGLCEKECCDGSDEPSGICPNVCEEVGREYRTKMEAEAKTRRTGAKIRSTYIQYAEKEKKRIIGSIATLKAEVEAKKQEEQHAKILLDHAESISQASLEHKKKSPLYMSLEKHAEAVKSLQNQLNSLNEREKQLSDVLRNLKSGYNPNYQDMAVLEAVRGWDGLNPDAPQGTEEVKEGEEKKEEVKEETEDEKLAKKWDQRAVTSLLREDLVALLLQHDKHVEEDSEEGEDGVFDLDSYVPESLYPHYENARTQVVGWLTKIGVVREGNVNSEAAAKARERHNIATNQLRNAETKLRDEEQSITRINDPAWFGADGAWKKLDNMCLSLDTGEYTYEICLFNQAMQKSNKGGGNHSLGKFSSWNTDAPVGSPEYYSKMRYTRGARCWNGPERSITIDLVCGTENALLTVSEPEKCEYRVTGTSPALCLPDTANSSPPSAKDPKEEL